MKSNILIDALKLAHDSMVKSRGGGIIATRGYRAVKSTLEAWEATPALNTGSHFGLTAECKEDSRNDVLTIKAPNDWQLLLRDFIESKCIVSTENTTNGLPIFDNDRANQAYADFMATFYNYVSWAKQCDTPDTKKYREYSVRITYDHCRESDYFGLMIQGNYTCLVLIRSDLSVSGNS